MQIGKAEEGVDFADSVNKFLRAFGLQRDYQELTEAAGRAGGTVGSDTWFVGRFNLSEQLLDSGQTKQAKEVCADILAGLGETPSGNRCLTLSMLGCCCKAQGQLAEAEQRFRQELDELARLEQDDKARRQTGIVQAELADVLCDQGRHKDAEAAFQAGLEIIKELGDMRSVAVITGQLGTLAWRQGELAEAAERYIETISLFHSLNEPAHEAVSWHQLGIVYQQAEYWEKAERAYRQSAQLKEEQGLLSGSVSIGNTWQQLALLCKATGRVPEAEQWFRKALAAFKDGEDWPNAARTLSNLASLLANNPTCLDEDRDYAEEALAIFETLDPAVAELWKIYNVLADIASQQGENSQAAAYRAKSRQAYFAFPGWRQQLYRHEPMIAAVVQGGDVEAALAPYGEAWDDLKAAIRHILSGERDEAALCEPLGWEEAAIIRVILEGIDGQG